MIIGILFLSFSQAVPHVESSENFQVYWNVPTFMCHQYGMFFEEVSQAFGILQNAEDRFRGDRIAILYDPGIFPALIKEANGKLMRRNGGVPQEGNLTWHLQLFMKHLSEQIPDEDFQGLGVIDFESWRPIFRQNWASLAPYRDLSIDIERNRHPLWDKKSLEKEAARRFEKAGRLFMEETLRVAKNFRPKATWGYYAYPYCFNLTPYEPGTRCDPQALKENDKMSWLFDHQQALYSSLYLRSTLKTSEKVGLISGRVKEALRVSRRSKSKPIVIPYFWYKYQDKRDVFLDMENIDNGLREIENLGANGVIIWGSSNDLNNRTKCQDFRDYLNNVLGPIAKRLKDTKSRNLFKNLGNAEISSEEEVYLQGNESDENDLSSNERDETILGNDVAGTISQHGRVAGRLFKDEDVSREEIESSTRSS
ncbi:hyaluronidase-like [Orussus abietinus]|uniref:hyaluronidase-like n=1 Tax=Orussus abietinus TaxID=222816 RepID=UPI000625D323|nr:hyaluronidase-like [Orussus abietinus]